MLKKYKNAIFQAVQEYGFEASKIETDEHEVLGHDWFSLTFLDSNLVFEFRCPLKNPHVFDAVFNKFGATGAFDYPDNDDHEGAYVDFAAILGFFKNWLSTEIGLYLEEQSLPDFWAQARGQIELLEPNPPTDEETAFFSKDEKAQLRFSLQDFKRLVEAEFKPEPEQLELINARLDYLTEAVDRLNRYDWKGVAISTVIGIATTLTLDTQRGQVLWGLFQTALRAAFQLMGS